MSDQRNCIEASEVMEHAIQVLAQVVSLTRARATLPLLLADEADKAIDALKRLLPAYRE